MRYSPYPTRAFTLALFLGCIPALHAQTAPRIVWQRCLGSSANDGFASVAQSHDGGYIAVGSTTTTDEGDVSGGHGNSPNSARPEDAWVVKLTSTGKIQWQRCLGGKRNDEADAVIPTPDGGYLVGCTTESSDGDVTENKGGLYGPYDRYPDIWLVKLDSVGQIRWQRTLGGEGTDVLDQLITTADGGYALIAETLSTGGDITGFHPDNTPADGANGSDIWIAKLDSDGMIEWSSAYGGSRIDRLGTITEAPDHGFVFAALSISSDGDLVDTALNGSTWVAKLDPFGNLRWQHRFSALENDVPSRIITTADGGYALIGKRSGSSELLPNHGYEDLWVLKLDSVGRTQWEQDYGGSRTDWGTNISERIDGGYTILGWTGSNDGNVAGLHGQGSDVWILQLNSLGEIIWQHCYGGTSSESNYYGGYYDDRVFSRMITQADGSITIAGSTRSHDGDVSGLHNNGSYRDRPENDLTTDAWLVHLK
jgi:hypothetical protein